MLMSVGIRSPSRGSEIKRLTSSDMSLATEWMAVTFRATFFGPHGLWNNPFGALMPGKVIEFGWTNVLTWLRWKLNTFSILSALTHKGPGEQPHAKLWVFPPAVFLRIPTLNSCRRTSFRLHQGAYQLKGRHLRKRVESIRTWLVERRVDLMLGQGCLTNSSTDSECTILEASSVAS